MIDRDHGLSIRRQAKALGISRGSVYYASVSEARASICRYLGFCNGTRPHSSHGGRTPDQAYINQPTPIPAAA